MPRSRPPDTTQPAKLGAPALCLFISYRLLTIWNCSVEVSRVLKAISVTVPAGRPAAPG